MDLARPDGLPGLARPADIGALGPPDPAAIDGREAASHAAFADALQPLTDWVSIFALSTCRCAP